MLGKLLKYEWKATWKIPTILIGLLLILSVLSGFSFASPVWRSDMGGLDLLVILVWMVFYFALIGVSIGITLYMAIHFYKTMFTDEGLSSCNCIRSVYQLCSCKEVCGGGCAPFWRYNRNHSELGQQIS